MKAETLIQLKRGIPRRHTNLLLDDTLGVCIVVIGSPSIVFPAFQYDITKPRASGKDIVEAIRLWWFEVRGVNIRSKIGTTNHYSYARGWDNPDELLTAREERLRKWYVPVRGGRV